MDGTVAVRVALYLVLLVAIPLGFAALFYPLYYFRHDGLIEQFRGKRDDAMALSAHWEAAEDGITCAHCGAANGPGYNYCHNCQQSLPEDEWNL